MTNVPDPELERILAMSDEEILDEMIASGDDPEVVAKGMRELFERVLAQEPTKARRR